MNYSEKLRIEREFLAAAKAGDSVYRISYGGWAKAEKLEIERTTKTQLILKNGVRLKRSDCREVSAVAYSQTFYVPVVEHTTLAVASSAAFKSEKRAAEQLTAHIEALQSSGRLTVGAVAELNATLERLGLAAPVAS